LPRSPDAPQGGHAGLPLQTHLELLQGEVKGSGILCGLC